MQPILIVLLEVRVWNINTVVDYGWIIRYIKKYEGLSSAYIAVLDPLSDYI